MNDIHRSKIISSIFRDITDPGKQVIAIDGKGLRRSFENGDEKHNGMIHMV